MSFRSISFALSPALSARVICPWTSFLVPPRAHLSLKRPKLKFGQPACPRPYQHAATGQDRQRQKHGPAKGRQQTKRRGVFPPPQGEENAELIAFQSLATSGDREAIMLQYAPAVDTLPLAAADTFNLARMLHHHYRARRDLDEKTKQAIKDNVDTLIRDIKRGKLPPHPLASLHILSYFKEASLFDAGVRWWQWLRKRDSQYADARTYGAAIEMLAFYGEPLPSLEQLYNQALKLFPGDFSEYHLSPAAIVVDRSQPTRIVGVKTSLLQGIVTARLLHANWRDAYLALDTALRLHPTQVPKRMFEVFCYERPLTEAYTVYMLGCRSGTVPKANSLTWLLEKISEQQRPNRSCDTNVSLVVAMLNAFRAYLGAGGAPDAYSQSSLVGGFFGMFDAIPSEEADNQIKRAIAALFVTFGQLGVPPHNTVYNVMMSKSARLKRQDLFDWSLESFGQSGLTPNSRTLQTLLKAGGELQKPELVRVSWERLVAMQSHEQLRFVDWKSLARAAQKANIREYAVEQIQKAKLSGSLDELIKRYLGPATEIAVSKAPEELPPFVSSDNDVLSYDEIFTTLSAINDDISSSAPLDFAKVKLKMHISTSHTPESSEAALRELYDRMTTDPAAVTKETAEEESSTPAAKLSMGYSLEELRYENWKTVNELLLEAEKNELRRERAAEQALEQGVPLSMVAGRVKTSGLSESSDESSAIVRDGDKTNGESIRDGVDGFLAKIMALRR